MLVNASYHCQSELYNYDQSYRTSLKLVITKLEETIQVISPIVFYIIIWICNWFNWSVIIIRFTTLLISNEPKSHEILMFVSRMTPNNAVVPQSSIVLIVLVKSHQRWKQTRIRVCFHLLCELTFNRPYHIW